MKHYLLAVHSGGDAEHGDASPEAMDAFMQRVNALEDAMRDQGVLVFGGGLEPAAMATVVRSRDGGAVVTDGPFVEAKEHIAGLYLIAAADSDTAHEWARRTSEAILQPIEVRLFQAVSPT